ncbi:MAG: sigma factor-like helix-turn-helix DNA-binding protein, partial [Gaiellaceae bacterium]
DLHAALLALSPLDREALLLVAWEDLTAAQAARALGINATAFRVRLLRARRRLRSLLEAQVAPGVVPQLDVEGS